jgi:hypothetical protein
MMGATRGRPVEYFSAPTGTVTRLVCAESGMLATDHCPNVRTQTFNEGSEPSEICRLHPGRPLERPPDAETPTETEAPPPGTAPAAAPNGATKPAGDVKPAATPNLLYR